MSNTVKVRIAVAVESSSDWSAYGVNDATDAILAARAVEWLNPRETQAIHYIEADVPLPASQTVEGKVVE